MSPKSIENLPIYDAKKAILLSVTDNDCSRADRKEPDSCAVARACRRELHALDVRVHLGRVYVKTNKGSWTRYITPPALRSEIIAFDRGGTFAAGVFTLSAPQPTKQASGKRQGSNKRTVAKSLTKRRPPHVVKDVRLSITRHVADGL